MYKRTTLVKLNLFFEGAPVLAAEAWLACDLSCACGPGILWCGFPQANLSLCQQALGWPAARCRPAEVVS